MIDIVGEEERKVFRGLFHGYLEMLHRQIGYDPLLPSAVPWLAAMYADVNTRLWKDGWEKLKREGGGSDG